MGINSKLVQLSSFLVVSALFLSSCRSREEVEKQLAEKIATESCKEFTQLSSGLVRGIVSGIASYVTEGAVRDVNTGSFGELPPQWCNCYTYIVSEELIDKFTREELLELRRDKVKKLMVIGKIIEVREVDLKRCIVESSQQAVSDYDEFTRDLNEKFK